MAWYNTFSEDARSRMLEGARLLAHAVGSSMGPAGRNCVIDLAPQVPGTPLSTRDGVTIARNIYFQDHVADAGSRLIRAAAERTVEEAGDGTSASVVLAHGFYARGLELLPTLGVRGVLAAITDITDFAVGQLNKLVVPVSGSMIDFVATISVNNDPVLGKQVADAIRMSGAHGVVSVEDSGSAETEIERQEGMQFSSGWRSNGFVNRADTQACEMDNPLIFMLDRRLTSLQGLLPMLGGIEKSGRPLLVLAEDVDGEALASLLILKSKGALQVCCVKLPSNLGHRKDLLLDIAALCGGRPMLREMQENPADAKPDDLGQARRVLVTRNSTRIVGGAGEPKNVKARVEEIYGLLKSDPPQIERERLQERLGKLTGGVTVLRLGAQTGLELGDKKMRVDDAVCAINCAIQEGVVPGAGTSLLRIGAVAGSEDSVPQNPFASVLELPFCKILENAGHDPLPIRNRVLTLCQWDGFNVLTGEYGDLREAGVLDPLKVVRQSLLNAASVARQMLLTDTVVSLVR